MNILMNKPIFELKINAFGVSYLLRMNGVSVLKEYDPFSQISTTIAVNHLMTPSENILTLVAMPEGEGESFNTRSYISVELWVKSYDQNNDGYLLASIDFNGDSVEAGLAASNSTPHGRFASSKKFLQDEMGDVEIGKVSSEEVRDFKGAYIFERNMNIPSSLPLWNFFRSEELPDYDRMPDDEYYRAIADLFVLYKTLQDALANGNVDPILSLFEERNSETDLAFYLQPGTTGNKLRSSMVDAISDQNLELAALSPEFLNIRLESNRKLVSLIRDEEMSAVGFNYKTFVGSKSYHLILRRENGKWIITR